MSKLFRWWQRLLGKQSSSMSETALEDMGCSVQHVELADFLNAAGGTSAVPTDMAVQTLVWKALQSTYPDNAVCTMPSSAPKVPIEDRISEIELKILRSFLWSGSIHLAIVPEYGILLANMAAVRDVAQAKGDPAFLFASYSSFHTCWSHLVTSMVDAGLSVAKIHLHGERAEIEVVGR